MDALQWMGAVRTRVQTDDKNISIIQSISWLVKKKLKETNPPLRHFNCTQGFFPLYCFSSKKSSWLNQKRNMHRSNMWVDFDVKGQQGWTSLEEALLWIMAKRNCSLKLKCLDWFVFTNTQLFSSQDIMDWVTCGLLRCFYQLFGLSFWRHPFRCIGGKTDIKWNFSKSVAMKKSTSCLAWGGGGGGGGYISANDYFSLNRSFKLFRTA